MAGLLTEAQKQIFRSRGYLYPLTAMGEAAAGQMLAALEQFEAAHGGFGQHLRFKAHLRLAALMKVATLPRILDAVEDLIGPDILLFTSTLWPKDGGDGRYVSWHQDSAYFGFDRHDEVTAWVAVTASHRGNGCVRVMPGSHLGPDYEHEETLAKENMLIRGQTIHGLDESRAVNLELRPGQFSLHHERMAHGSLPNASSDRRIGYALFYIPTHVRSTLGRRTALLVRGKDEYGHWDADPVPRGDNDPLIADFIRRTFHQYRDQESSPA
ncbi:MAG TPA: phytanoyl-CoA dioxygenase family protein [Alphaproteobacteria bacterium]|nr:phytanoyl-CoA dioxygenase family protein [Alphaproteobacteria bacterium]